MTDLRGDLPGDATRMVTALVRLRSALQAAPLPLDVDGAEAQRAVRQELIDQLEDYVIPRVMTVEAPMLVVVGGSTGAGKSTLVNSLVGHKVTQPGLLRPTTRSAVLVHHPDDAQWFGQDRLLPDLRRVSEPTNDHDALQLVPSEKMPAGLAIIDAPDVDSVEKANRELAVHLLAAADLWLFVTSAARYADQVPWEHLKAAAGRSTAVAIVLDRTPPDAVQTVATHLARMLASRGLKDSPLFIVNEGPVTDDGLLPASYVADIRGWLESLAADTSARTGVVRQTLEGTIRSLTHRVHPVAEATSAQTEACAVLRDAADTAYDEATAALLAAASDGTLLRGDLLARWHEYVGTGELLRSLDDRVSRIRDRVLNAVKGKPQQADHVTVAVEAAVENLVLERAEQAAERATAAWCEHPAGPGALARSEQDLTRASHDLRRRAERAVREWQQDVTELIRSQGSEARATARFLAYGVHGLGVALMVVSFDQSATHASARVGRQLLDAVFGQGASGSLARRGWEALDHRLRDLMDSERGRYHDLLGALGIDADAASELRQACRRVDDVRFAARQPGE